MSAAEEDKNEYEDLNNEISNKAYEVHDPTTKHDLILPDRETYRILHGVNLIEIQFTSEELARCVCRQLSITRGVHICLVSTSSRMKKRFNELVRCTFAKDYRPLLVSSFTNGEIKLDNTSKITFVCSVTPPRETKPDITIFPQFYNRRDARAKTYTTLIGPWKTTQG